VLRLYLVLEPGLRIELPATVREDLVAFLRGIEPELNPQLLHQLGIKGVGVAEALQTIRTVYGILNGEETSP